MHHILKRLETKEFIDLWHFTAQGCCEATTLELTAPENAFSFISTEKGPMLQPAGAASISSSKVTRDEALSYDQWSEGKNQLLNCMAEHGWSAQEVNQLAKFFLNLDFHLIRSESFGLQTVLRYQERVRCNWTLAVKGNKPYGIGTINANLLEEYHRQVLAEAQALSITQHVEFVREQRKLAEKQSSRQYTRTQDTCFWKRTASQSRSLLKRTSRAHRHSCSPDQTRKASFRSSATSSSRLDKLPACPICLGRHRYRTASC